MGENSWWWNGLEETKKHKDDLGIVKSNVFPSYHVRRVLWFSLLCFGVFLSHRSWCSQFCFLIFSLNMYLFFVCSFRTAGESVTPDFYPLMSVLAHNHGCHLSTIYLLSTIRPRYKKPACD